jgi:hypothetical protein
MNQRDIAAAFARRESGVSYSAMAIKYPIIYSYATPMAVHIDGHTVIVNRNRYSVTTSKHQGMIGAALSMAGYRNTGDTDAYHHVGWYNPDYQSPFEVWKKE